MREIKFRVWNIDGYISLNKAIHDDIIVIQVPSSSNNSLIEVNWEGVELEQFTGCINKQDVEIYEGDIVEDSLSDNYLNGEYIRGVVVFRYYKFVVSYTHPDGIVFYDELDSSFIVVGNIHQHAHLLENKWTIKIMMETQ